MSDETIRVVYDVTAKGMENVRRLIGDIRKELGNAGVDTSRFESRLEGVERTVAKVNTALKAASASSQAVGRTGAAAAKQNSKAWEQLKKDIESAQKVASRGVKAATNSQTPQSGVASGKRTDVASWNAQFDALSRAAALEARLNKERIASEQKVATEKERLAAQQDRIYNQYMEAQYAADKKAADRKIAEATRAAKETERILNQGLTGASRGAGAASSFLDSQARTSKRATRKSDFADWDADFKKATIAAREFESAQNGIIAQRYALYDVAATYGIIGAALVGAATYAAIVGARFESAFTNVERTLASNVVPAQVEEIRQSLVRLSGQIPLTFQELSQIATIGNQMGIAEDNIVGFTNTIARFASVSGISIEGVTKAFGTFMAQTGLAPEYLENLGSAIAKVGIDSNATEEQIVSLMREITAGAQQAGFTADQIVGLSGTLAGLAVAPERARGSLGTYFATLNTAVAEGGDKLENFAKIVGVTSTELERMVRNGEGNDILRGFITGLNDLDNVDTTSALDALNLAQLRVSDTFIRLSNDLSIYDRDQRNANTAFMQGAELQRQYAMTVDDLASQWIIFTNNLNGAIDAITGGAVPGLAALFTAINSVLSALINWLGDNQWAAAIIAFTVAVAGAFGTILLFRAASLTATAALLALRVLTQQAGASAIVAAGGFRGLIGTLFGVQAGANAAAGGIFTLRSAIRALLASTGIGLLVTLGGSLIEGFMGQDSAAGDAALSLDEYNKAVAASQGASNGAAEGADNLADSLGGGGGGGGVGGAADEAAQKVRTLVDYVNDLSGVFRRAGDIRFGSTAAMDEITLKWIELNEEAEEYQRQIRSLTADRNLQSYWLGIAELYDDQVRASQLREGIAKIDDEMAEAQQGASRELTGNSRAAIENRKTMRDLLGSYEDYVSALAAAGASQEEIQRVISSLNGDFTTQAQQLGYAGGELITYQQRFGDLASIVNSMPRDITVGFNGDPAAQAMAEFFAKQAEAAALAGAAAGDGYGGGFAGGLGTGIENGMPAVEEAIKSGTNPIEENFKNFLGRQHTAWSGFFDDIRSGKWWQGVLDSFAVSFSVMQTNFNVFIGKFLGGWTSFFNELASGKWWNNVIWEFKKAWSQFLEGISQVRIFGAQPFAGLTGTRSGSGGGFAGGGYTGPGHWLQPAGIVHAGEYVIPKKHVDQRTGLPDMGYVNSLKKSKSAGPGYAMGGHVSGGGGFGGPIELGPATLHYLGQAMQVRLDVDSRDLATASSRGDKQAAWAGSN